MPPSAHAQNDARRVPAPGNDQPARPGPAVLDGRESGSEDFDSEFSDSDLELVDKESKSIPGRKPVA